VDVTQLFLCAAQPIIQQTAGSLIQFTLEATHFNIHKPETYLAAGGRNKA
jgi:hypothetical protein